MNTHSREFREYRFGPFRLLPDHNLLFEGGERKQLGSRALAILTLLVERQGTLVPTGDIIKCAWPHTFVEDNNVRVHITTLRKALENGAGSPQYIVNVPGRGYKFVAGASLGQVQETPAAYPAVAQKQNLPLALASLVGREQALAELIEQIPKTRVLTLVGPGGVGKSCLAKAGAQQLAGQFGNNVCFADFAMADDSAQVPGFFASCLQCNAPSAANSADLLQSLCSRHLLLVLDNCDQVVNGVALLIETLLQGYPGIKILATSREPLRTEGERVQQLMPLELPPEHGAMLAADVMRFASARLFVERTGASSAGFRLTDINAAAVAGICRSLDGLPLAIELAASCATQLGMDVLTPGLPDRLSLLTLGRRTDRRHQSLRSMMDWGYDNLAERERNVFARLGVFAGNFSLRAALAVAIGDGIDRAEALQAFGHLTAVSLVACDTSGPVAVYRLLESTRMYAAEKLNLTVIRAHIRRRHALHCCEQLEADKSQQRGPCRDGSTFTGDLGLDDVRAALDWAFSSGGEAQLGLRLLSASFQLWLAYSKPDEFYRRLNEALASYPANAPVALRKELQAHFSVALLLARLEELLRRPARAAGRWELLSALKTRREFGPVHGGQARIPMDAARIAVASQSAANAERRVGNRMRKTRRLDGLAAKFQQKVA